MKRGKRRLRAIATGLSVCLLISFGGCTNDPAPPVDTQTTEVSALPSPIRTEGKWRIGESDTMRYYFHVSDYSAEEAEAIHADLVRLAADICAWLGVDADDMVTSDGEKPICYFYSNARMEDGQNRSHADWTKREMWCTSLNHFVHEYVHMVTLLSDEKIYTPENLLIEGLATYVGYTWQETLATGDYATVPYEELRISEGDPVGQAVIERMNDASLDQTMLNFYRAELAYVCQTYGVDVALATEQTNNEYFKYHVGCILIDYLMRQAGGIEDVMSLYFDSLSAEAIYGAPLEELVRMAVEDCWAQSEAETSVA